MIVLDFKPCYPLCYQLIFHIMKNLEELCEKLNYNFNCIETLEEALRHSSYVNENRDLDLGDNERLEFLGDAVLDLAISHILMEKFTDLKEGDLSKYRAAIVNESSLLRIAKDLDLGEYIFLGKGEENATNGTALFNIGISIFRNNPSKNHTV